MMASSAATAWAIVAFVLYSKGRKTLKQVDPKRVTQVDMSRFKTLNPKPEQTVASVKEDVRWTKEQMS